MFLTQEQVLELKYETLRGSVMGTRKYLVLRLAPDYLREGDYLAAGISIIYEGEGGWFIENFGQEYSKSVRRYDTI